MQYPKHTLCLVEAHQSYQKKLIDIQQQIKQKDTVIRELAVQLRGLEKQLQEIVDIGKKRIDALEQAKKGWSFTVVQCIRRSCSC